MKTFILKVLLLAAASMIVIICILQTGRAYAVPKPSEKKQIKNVYTVKIEQHTLPSRSAPPMVEEKEIVSVISYAESFIGTRYAYGASGPKAFDCSGFTMYIMARLGIDLPHSARGQYAMGMEVDKENLIPGDLVFFKTSDSVKVSHVGMYIGNNSFIHASLNGVMINSLEDGYYKRRYVTAARIIPK